MVCDKEGNPFALSVDRDSTLLFQVRQYFGLYRLQFDQAFSMRQAQDLLSQRLYCLLWIRSEIAAETEVLELCSSFRARNRHAITMVFGDALDPRQEERLFDHGVNDVVSIGQSSPPALAKRVHAQLHAAGILPSCPRRIRVGDALVDFDRREVFREHAVHRLPGILADLLRYLVENADHVVSREELQQSPIWLDSICTPATQGGKTFDVNIGKLRKIIELDPHQPRIILSVRGVGWKLASEMLQHEFNTVGQS
jgi:DNA-binding response OmpR family regulator